MRKPLTDIGPRLVELTAIEHSFGDSTPAYCTVIEDGSAGKNGWLLEEGEWAHAGSDGCTIREREVLWEERTAVTLESIHYGECWRFRCSCGAHAFLVKERAVLTQIVPDAPYGPHSAIVAGMLANVATWTFTKCSRVSAYWLTLGSKRITERWARCWAQVESSGRTDAAMRAIDAGERAYTSRLWQVIDDRSNDSDATISLLKTGIDVVTGAMLATVIADLCEPQDLIDLTKPWAGMR